MKFSAPWMFDGDSECLSTIIFECVDFISLEHGYRRNRLLFSSWRQHILEIFGAVGPHISSLASPVFVTRAKFLEKKEKSKTSECFRTYPNVSEHIGMHPSRSEQLPACFQTYENFEKLAKTSRKLRETRASAVVDQSIGTRH